MKILQPGLAPSEKEYEASCLTCKCRIQFKQHEADAWHGGRNESGYKIKCPTRNCGDWIWVNS